MNKLTIDEFLIKIESLKEKDLHTCWKMYEYRFKRINDIMR